MPPQAAKKGSDLLVSPYITFTAAHVLVDNGEQAASSFSDIGAWPNGSGGYNVFNGTFVSVDSRYSSVYDAQKNKNDYGVLRQDEPFMFSFYSNFRRENTYPRTVNVVGYPRDLIGMHKGNATAKKNENFFCTQRNGTIYYPMNTVIGMSGGPIFNADNTFTTGIHGYHCTVGGITYGNGIQFDEANLTEILTWMWYPTGKMRIDYPEPNIDINLVAIQNFDANFSPFNLMNIHGDIEIKNDNFDDSIRWESSINGTLGTGGELSADVLKSRLTSGNHRITAIIDSNGESGEKNVNINVIRPRGQFTSPNQCIKNIANPNTCNFNLSWTVRDTPETSVVLNSTTGNNFATGNSGTRTVTATDGQNINFKLYPSNQKKILLDGLNTNNLSRKTPTGILSRSLTTCSLQPSPVDPVNLVLRDAKATPPGCGVELSWSNVKWASPSIYYRKAGQSSWTHLYKIPCQMNGSVCNGSMNTDDIIPELVPKGGIQFKLLQFNQANSGQLSAPFSVNAHRYADAYDYDNGDVRDFGDFGIGFPTHMVIDHRLSNNAVIGVAQHNHNFHSPAPYDPREDIDTIQVPTANYAEGKVMEVTVFNRNAGLDVDMTLMCGGIARNGLIDGQSGLFDFNNNPTDPITTDPVTGAKTMRFRITKTTRQILSDIDCLYNRVVIKRTAGTPSEQLTYSVVINDPTQPSGPVINTAQSMCNHNYCIQLLGSGFGDNASVKIRENIAGSTTIATISSHNIYNRNPLNGQERLQWPIQSLSLQQKFRTIGLCFTVVNGSTVSNERCFKRPTTPEQGPFMGKTVSSYSSNQDVEHSSYVVVGNGTKLKLLGNSWKKIPYSHHVTPHTILEFSFRSTHQQALINGIGFIMNGQTTISSNRTWQVYGTQNYGNQSHHNYTGNNWVTYRIPIGESFTGQISHMVFIGDEDNNAGQNVVYRSPRLFEDAQPPNFPVRGYVYDPIKAGHGMFIGKSSNNRYLVYFYSYDSNNQPEWYYSLANFSNNTLSGNLFEVTHNANNNSNTQRNAGSFTLDYNSHAVDANQHCDGVNRLLGPAAFSWSIDGQSGNWCMQAVFKNNATPQVPSTHSGVWYESGSNAWGSSLQTIQSGNNTQSFAVIYYYDASGKARWASALDANATTNNHDFNMLHTTGYPRNASGSISNQNIGTANLNFGSENKASIDINYPVSPHGSLDKSHVKISRLAQ